LGVGQLDARLSCRFGECPVMVIVKEQIAAIKVRDENINVSIIVIVGGGHSLGKNYAIHTGGMGNILKSPVAAVAEQLTRAIFVTNEQVDEAVVINVSPDGSLCARCRFRQPGGLRNIGESAVAVISQKRLTYRKLPGAAQNQQIHTTVIVIVGLNHVQSAQLLGQSSFAGTVSEGTVTIVMKIVKRLA